MCISHRLGLSQLGEMENAQLWNGAEFSVRFISFLASYFLIFSNGTFVIFSSRFFMSKLCTQMFRSRRLMAMATATRLLSFSFEFSYIFR